jgi:hypothetical protein
MIILKIVAKKLISLDIVRNFRLIDFFPEIRMLKLMK